MNRKFLITWVGVFVLTAATSIIWHVALFEQRYLELGVFTRMADPIYAFGFLAWIMEATAITLLYVHSKWADHGLWGALKLSWCVSLYAAASALVGTAAKVEISDLTGWFLIAGGFIFLHATVLAAWLAFSPRAKA
ncbi:hypothetical protein K1718_00185 [Roseibium porphyridii]|uniref:Uncharacterized protein n=1 Tax=Roseibium porphyridii TaxID=2866279 RepID=A0ABY8F5V1_9HYPH|nr:hypothetical protein [Roseibium sp. KMA01]WFE89814.1 hypothetical protein K1718_00185 [Roseibium sp. KMA01]